MASSDEDGGVNDDGGTTGDMSDTGMDADSTGSMGDPSTGAMPAGDVPTEGAALLTWLEDGNYLDWSAESSVHGPTGTSPHNDVRVFINAALEGSLQASDPIRPLDAAAVKELYDEGGALFGWAVMVKVDDSNTNGDSWYWYEILDGGVVADGVDEGLCSGCHAAGLDHILTTYPLE